MDVKKILEAIEEVAKQKGIETETVKSIVLEAIKKGFIKKIQGEEDSFVEVYFDELKGKIIGEQKRIVVPNDYGNSDIDIRLEDAKKIKKDAKIDDEIVEKFDLTNDDEIGRAMALAIKNTLSQKLAEVEKAALYERFHDKKDEMVTGEVERSTDGSVTVKLYNGPSIYVGSRDLIGDEKFSVGQQIRLYVSDVSQTGKGGQIKVTRANEGFLKRIFEEEIHEVYDGTVVIKGIARSAGIRSKVAVSTTDDNVDAIGAIIGPNGSRIQRVVNQLGNGKEKIDVFLYNSNIGLYICAALKPANIKGISINEEAKKAIAVVDDGQASLAIGKKFANVLLASKLTGYQIEIMEMSKAIEAGIELKDQDTLKREQEEKDRLEKYNAYLRTVKASETVATPVVKEETTKVAPKAEEKVAAPVVETVAAEEVAPVAEEKSETPVVHVEVKTTSSLDELEKEIEASKNKANSKQKVSKVKRPKAIVDDEEETKEVKPVAPAMAIYTEEELAAMEAEEADNEEEFDEEDYDEYDEYDKYYDDEN